MSAARHPSPGHGPGDSYTNAPGLTRRPVAKPPGLVTIIHYLTTILIFNIKNVPGTG